MIPSHKMTKNTPSSRVELHVHLDGSIRHETIWDLAKEKKINLPGIRTFRDLKEALTIRDPIDLQHFLSPFKLYLPTVVGDFDAIERIAYEFCEDESRSGVHYVEARYSPHLFLTEGDARRRMSDLCNVINSVNRGFERGEKDFKVKARSILCTLNGTGTVNEVLELVQKYKGEGVVGMDMASNVFSKDPYVEVPLNPAEIHAYQEAKKMGIHRTLHAGEAGGAEMVKRAVNDYETERVGHGYRVLEDLTVYNDCRNKDVHFECCPWSSYLTGAVPLGVKEHPIVRFAEDNLNFSINSDDTTVTGLTLADDYILAASWGLTEAHFIRANLNAARSCFLPENEKNKLIKELLETYGINI